MKKKIMVVDDEPDVAYTAKSNLELFNTDYEITCVYRGKDCIKLLQDNQIPDLILLDIMMPEMDGWEVFDKLQKNPSWRNIHIIFVTGTDDAKENAKVILSDDHFLEKPYKPLELREKVSRVLS